MLTCTSAPDSTSTRRTKICRGHRIGRCCAEFQDRRNIYRSGSNILCSRIQYAIYVHVTNSPPINDVLDRIRHRTRGLDAGECTILKSGEGHTDIYGRRLPLHLLSRMRQMDGSGCDFSV